MKVELSQVWSVIEFSFEGNCTCPMDDLVDRDPFSNQCIPTVNIRMHPGVVPDTRNYRLAVILANFQVDQICYFNCL
jgi:hypothetical protein